MDFMLISFFIFGHCNLLVWNSVLAVLNFFQKFHDLWSVGIIYPFMYFSTTILFQFLLIIFNKQSVTYRLKIIFSIISFIILLLLYPIIVLYTEKHVGFVLMCITMLYTGFVSALCSSSFYGLMGHLHTKYIVTFSLGCAYVGILMNILRYIALLSFRTGTEEEILKKTTVMFFSITAVIMFICLILFLMVYKDANFRTILIKIGEINNVTSDTIDENLTALDQIKEGNDQIETNKDNNVTTQKEGISLTTFINGVKSTLSINVLMCLIYVITFMFYPNSIIFLKFFSVKDMNYSINTIQTIFNICEIIGRNLLYCLQPSQKKLYIVTLSRIICIILVPFTIYLQNNEIMNNIHLSSIVLVFVLIFMGSSNGFGTSLAFALAPMQAPNELKSAASKCVGFFLILGIFLGTCIAFGVEPLVGLIPKKNSILV